MTGTGQIGQSTHADVTPAQQRRADRKERAIEALREYGTLQRAAEAAGVARSTLYKWREDDPQFEALVKEWIDEDMEAELHDTLFTIAKKGADDPKYANAAVRAAELLIKAENPSKYGDKLKVESEQTINHQIQVVHEVRDQHRQLQQERLRRLAERTIEAEPIQQATTAESQN
ncbi:MAG: phBC6A51 family helix-turn-helix protein [Deinococcus sp.]|nr:phBC6A51 family helix-turn-helix protein [Deinococcus sp.]